MKNQSYHQFKWTFPALLLVLSVTGCSSRVSQMPPTSMPAASPNPTIIETAIPAVFSEPTPTPTVAPMPTQEPAANQDVYYQDDFADPASGWPKEEFDNYFIGYHEPDYYHVDVRSPNDKETGACAR